MGYLEDTEHNLQQLKETKEFLTILKPIDHKLKMLLMTLDSDINKIEQTVSELKGKVLQHRCGLCEYPYDEQEIHSIGSFKVCPSCRNLGGKFLLTRELEKKADLHPGSMKRDCLSIDGKPPKLQPFIDCGLVYNTGTHIYAHEIVIKLYYQNSDEYKRRKSRSSESF